jgi:hypothetical protein
LSVEPASDPRVVQLRRVLASKIFAKAPRLCSLLEFIGLHSVGGRHSELSEQQIGIHVFGKVPGYNSSEDTIVRGTARHLRQRLEQYYVTEGEHDPIRIDIPRGGYVAVFSDSAIEDILKLQTSSVSSLETAHSNNLIFSSDRTVPFRRKVRLLQSAATILLLAVIGLAIAFIQQKRTSSNPVLPVGPQPLWHAIFPGNLKTLIVPGDASLDTFIAWEQRDVSLQQYATQSYQGEPTVTRVPTHMDVPLSVRSETPMADLALVSTLVRASERMGEPRAGNSVEVRYARDVVVADTHDNNLIFIGAESFNPWVKLYQPEMDFTAHWNFATDIYRIDNRAPKSGELLTYQYDRRASEPKQSFTHIALLNNSQGIGRVLIIEGTTMGSIYGAVNFFTHESLWSPIIRQATGNTGKLRDFEVLLSGDLIHGGMGNTKVIAVHIH